MIETDCILKEGKRIAGVKQVIKGIINNNIKTVYIATDCDKHIENKVMAVVGEEVSVIRLYTQKQLGRACNIDVCAAVVGILADRDIIL